MIFSVPAREIFSSALGIVAGVIFTLGAFLKAALGKFKKAAPPVEEYEGSARAILNVLLFAPLIVALLRTTPNNASLLLSGCVVSGILSFVCRQQYAKAKAGHIFKWPVPSRFPRLRKFFGKSEFKEQLVVGGDALITQAAQDKARLHCTDQELFANNGYDPARLWDDKDRAKAQGRIERWYFAYVFLAVMTLVVASLALQATLSGVAPLEAAKHIWNKAGG